MDPKEHLARRVEAIRTRAEEMGVNGRALMPESAGPGDVRLDVNDYLNLGADPDILKAEAAALVCYGKNLVMSAVFDGNDGPKAHFEADMADFLGYPNATVYQSGYAANETAMGILCGPGVPVYHDQFAHPSLTQAARATGASLFAFRHNSPEQLSKLIERRGPGVIVVDSVYSLNGAICRLEAVTAIADMTGSMLLVDESHSLGTLGPYGTGRVRELALSGRVTMVTASLAKAFAGRAGIIAHGAELAQLAAHGSMPNIFSSALLPHEYAGLSATLHKIARATEPRANLTIAHHRIRAAAQHAGFKVMGGLEPSAQITALVLRSERAVIDLARTLAAAGIRAAPFLYPAAPRSAPVLRLTAHAGLTESDLARIEAALSGCSGYAVE